MKTSKDVSQYDGQQVKDKATQAVQSAAAIVQESVQAGLAKAQEAVLSGFASAQEALKGGQKGAAKNLKKAQKQARKSKGNVQGTLQARVPSGLPDLSKTQEMLLAGLGASLGVAQELLKGNRKRAAKNLKRAQKRAKKSLENLQEALQENVQPRLSQAQETVLAGLGTAQETLGKNVKRAGKGLKKARENLKDTGDALQSNLKGYARRRKRARTLFRLGLLTGIVVALLYTPWPGEEMRRQLAAFWQSVFQRQQ